jgi:hypothetical protein
MGAPSDPYGGNDLYINNGANYNPNALLPPNPYLLSQQPDMNKEDPKEEMLRKRALHRSALDNSRHGPIRALVLRDNRGASGATNNNENGSNHSRASQREASSNSSKENEGTVQNTSDHPTRRRDEDDIAADNDDDDYD